MVASRFDVSPFIGQDEGQHFDRKSLFEGVVDQKRPRDRRAVRDQVAEYVAAFANAEGGVLILGVEDGGSVTGHQYPTSAVNAILESPRNRLRPPQLPGFRVEHMGAELLVFDVPASDVPVQVDGDGFPLRMGDRTVQASESQIQALKFRGLAESWEAQPSPMSIADLDAALLQRARVSAGLGSLTNEEYLLKRKLADRRGTGIALRRAAELLFASDGPDHPNAGVRVFRVIGTERRVGVEHNVGTSDRGGFDPSDTPDRGFDPSDMPDRGVRRRRPADRSRLGCAPAKSQAPAGHRRARATAGLATVRAGRHP